MSFDATWEAVHAQREWGRYPPEELVRFMARRVPVGAQVLDLGCGSGACLWYLAREGYRPTGIDGSASACARASAYAPVVQGDLIALPFEDASFDVAIDICAIQHNGWDETRAIVREVIRVLRPAGLFFSMLVAEGTSSQPYIGKGRVTFFDRSRVDALFADLRDVTVDRSDRTDGGGALTISHFVVSAMRPPIDPDVHV